MQVWDVDFVLLLLLRGVRHYQSVERNTVQCPFPASNHCYSPQYCNCSSVGKKGFTLQTYLNIRFCWQIWHLVQICGGIVIDKTDFRIRRTFDTIKHHVLLSFPFLIIRKELARMIFHLSNWKQRVCVDRNNYFYLDCPLHVQQGCILGTILFTLHISD